MREYILHHAKNIDWRVWEEFKPMLTPIGFEVEIKFVVIIF